MSRLRSNNLVTSSFRASASLARCRALADSWLAMMATTTKTNSATQFCGAAMVSVWKGGSRKKLKAIIAATQIPIDTRRRATVAVARTTSKRRRAAMVGFGSDCTARSVAMITAIAIAPAPAVAASRRHSPLLAILDLDLHPQFDHALGRQPEERRCPDRVSRHQHEQPLAPHRHSRALRHDQRLPSQEKRNVIIVQHDAALPRQGERLRNV